MGSGSAMLRGYKVSKHNRSPPRSRYSPPRAQTPSPPIRELTENEKENMEVARVRAKWNAMERALAAEKARLVADAKRIANAIKKQNNRLARAAAVNVKNVAKLNKTFKNHKTILGRLRRLGARLRG